LTARSLLILCSERSDGVVENLNCQSSMLLGLRLERDPHQHIVIEAPIS
jgi:hypothetical protein